MKNFLKKENFIFLLLVISLFVSITVEFKSEKEEYITDKIYDLQVDYNAKLISNKELVKAIFSEVIEDTELSKLLYEVNLNINKDANRDLIFNRYKDKYERMKQQGVLQFHIHLPDGTSFLRFHRPKKFGDNLLSFRESVKKVIETKEPAYGLEVGRNFEGFRYVYPLFYNNIYVGSAEASIASKKLIEQLTDSLDAHYSLILKASLIDSIVTKEYIEKYYHNFFAHKEYYMDKSIYSQKLLEDSGLNSIKSEIEQNLKEEKSFVSFTKNKDNKTVMLVFIDVRDVKNQHTGYLFSIRDAREIDRLLSEELIKFSAMLLLMVLVFYFYKQGKNKTKTIEQLRNAIDQTTLVSKTDAKGIITYVNDKFSNISGYEKEELIGKPNNIVRHEDTPKDVFKDMWKTIKSKKTWHGKIKNKTKTGGSYTVDATVIPILDTNDEIVEYIAIRHDITELKKYKELLKHQLDDTTKSLSETVNYTSQYEEAINNSTAILKTDTNNIVTYANEQFCKISGYTLEELVGTNCEKLRCDEHIVNGDCNEVRETLSKRELATLIFTNIDKNAKNYTIDTVIYPITDIHNNIVEHLHVMHDISQIVALNKEIDETQKEVVFTMGAIGESRSKETGNHVKRVAEYSKLLAILYGLGKKEAELLKQASPMHDIGKVGIPDSVLKKPGPLDKDEWKIMKTHSNLGYEMLKHSDRDILKAAATVAKQHHEKWNGLGYPKGLKKEEIHIYGRITAIADVFDALGSDRVYKEAWPLDKILNLFKEESGEHFDPQLVKLFLENLDDFLKIRDTFKDIN